ncbi:hypothetical protein [Chamaesiphon minutus]|nr:hypothetical protein [Chamaesiphon minutus]
MGSILASGLALATGDAILAIRAIFNRSAGRRTAVFYQLGCDYLYGDARVFSPKYRCRSRARSSANVAGCGSREHLGTVISR